MIMMNTVHRPRTLDECGFQSKFDMIRHLKDGLAWALKKGVASCDMLRVAACRLRSGDTRMGLPAADDTCGAPMWSGKLQNAGGGTRVVVSVWSRGRGSSFSWGGKEFEARSRRETDRFATSQDARNGI